MKPSQSMMQRSIIAYGSKEFSRQCFQSSTSVAPSICSSNSSSFFAFYFLWHAATKDWKALYCCRNLLLRLYSSFLISYYPPSSTMMCKMRYDENIFWAKHFLWFLFKLVKIKMELFDAMCWKENKNLREKVRKSQTSIRSFLRW